MENGQHLAFGIAQCERRAGRQPVGDGARNLQSDWDRPQQAVRETHALAHGVEIGLSHESIERRKAAVQEQLEVAELPRGQIPRWPREARPLELGGAVGSDEEILECAAVRCREFVRRDDFSLQQPGMLAC